MTLFKNKYRVETTRLPGWDYASAGGYFVTICTRNRQPFFGQIKNGDMRLSPVGEIARDYWQQIPQHTTGNVDIDVFVVMPNHVHGIIIIHGNPVMVEALHCNASTITITATNTINNRMSQISPKAGSLGAILRSYKAAVSRWCTQNGYGEFGWQARFYDHIIRNERELHAVRHYIVNNPAKWEQDQNNQETLWM